MGVWRSRWGGVLDACFTNPYKYSNAEQPYESESFSQVRTANLSRSFLLISIKRSKLIFTLRYKSQSALFRISSENYVVFLASLLIILCQFDLLLFAVILTE